MIFLTSKRWHLSLHFNFIFRKSGSSLQQKFLLLSPTSKNDSRHLLPFSTANWFLPFTFVLNCCSVAIWKYLKIENKQCGYDFAGWVVGSELWCPKLLGSFHFRRIVFIANLDIYHINKTCVKPSDDLFYCTYSITLACIKLPGSRARRRTQNLLFFVYPLSTELKLCLWFSRLWAKVAYLVN